MEIPSVFVRVELNQKLSSILELLGRIKNQQKKNPTYYTNTSKKSSVYKRKLSKKVWAKFQTFFNIISVKRKCLILFCSKKPDSILYTIQSFISENRSFRGTIF